MCIYQGSNSPLLLETSLDAEDVSALTVTAYDEVGLQVANLSSKTTLSNGLITIALDQAETAAFPVGKLKLLIKWKNRKGLVEFAEEVFYAVKQRQDKGVAL